MNADDLAKLFPNSTESFRNLNAESSAYDFRHGAKIGADLQLQKLQTENPKRPDNKAVVPKADGKDHNRFRVTINLRVCDRRRRDADGAVTTLLDCIVSAVRRLAELDSGRKLARGVRRSR